MIQNKAVLLFVFFYLRLLFSIFSINSLLINLKFKFVQYIFDHLFVSRLLFIYFKKVYI